jgi:hypothetical protein
VLETIAGLELAVDTPRQTGPDATAGVTVTQLGA